MGLNGAWKIALVYALFSLAWILGSDRLFLLLFPEPQELTRWQTGKGLTFVFLSSLLIYLLSRREALAESARRKALEASQRRLHTLVENGRELIYLIGPQGQMLYASPNVAQVLGYDPLGYTRETLFILDFVHPEDRPYAEAALEDLLRHPGETREYRLRLLDAWGRVRAVRVWGKNLLEDPAVRGIVINVHDETELEEERARLKGVLEALPGAVYQVRVEEGQDPAYAPLVYATPRQAWEVLGHPAEALLEDPAFFFAKVHPEDRAKVEEAVRRAVAHPGEVQIATYRFLHGQKGTYVWLRDTLIYDPETRLLTGYT